MLTASLIRNIAYGTQGMPFSVVVESETRASISHYWTEAEAWAARDAAIDQGGTIRVRVIGAPTRIVSVVPVEATRLEIE